jgi:hypothetical protein
VNAGRFAAAAVETSATGLWVGASAGFAFVSAPIAFRLVTDRNVFAEITERSLARLANLTYFAAGLAGLIALGRAGLEREGRNSDVLRSVAAVCALGCIVYHQRAIVPAMTLAQAAMGGFAEVAQDDPKRIAYRSLHRRSTRAFGTALLFGVIQLVLAATRSTAQWPESN